MKQTFTSTYLKNLTLYIFVAIIGGVFTGYYFHDIGIKLGSISNYFFTILEIVILPIIFISIVFGICNLPDIKNFDRVIWQTILYFLSITSVCIILGFLFGIIIQPGSNTGVDTSHINTKLPSQFGIRGESFSSFSSFSRHGIFLFLSILIGIVLNLSKKREYFLVVINKGLDISYKMIKYLYIILPVVIFCNIAYGISLYGLNTLLPLSKLVATVYLADFVFIFGILGFISYLLKFNLWSFLINIKEEILLVITTSASKTAFPMIFDKMEAEGYSKKVLGFIIPLGYNFNLAGACIYLSIASIFLIQFYDITLTVNDYIWLFTIISITSKTASGVPGSGFLALIFTLNRFGKIPTTDLALLYSVDRFMNEARAVTNFIGIAFSSAVISRLNQFQVEEEKN